MGTQRQCRRVEVYPHCESVDFRIARFSGGAEYSFSGEATLSSDTHRKAWSRPPIGMEFTIVMFTSSGLLVRYLKVIEKSGYR
jgi:AP-2 complex subunit mu-1